MPPDVQARTWSRTRLVRFSPIAGWGFGADARVDGNLSDRPSWPCSPTVRPQNRQSARPATRRAIGSRQLPRAANGPSLWPSTHRPSFSSFALAVGPERNNQRSPRVRGRVRAVSAGRRAEGKWRESWAPSDLSSAIMGATVGSSRCGQLRQVGRFGLRRSPAPVRRYAGAAACRSGPSAGRSGPAPPGPSVARRRSRSPRRRTRGSARVSRTA
jgi:hypothetical protein